MLRFVIRLPGYIAGHLATGSCRCHGNISFDFVITWILAVLRRTVRRSEFQGLHYGSVCIVFQTTAAILQRSMEERKDNLSSSVISERRSEVKV